MTLNAWKYIAMYDANVTVADAAALGLLEIEPDFVERMKANMNEGEELYKTFDALSSDEKKFIKEHYTKRPTAAVFRAYAEKKGLKLVLKR